jgi:hypothetical protein
VDVLLQQQLDHEGAVMAGRTTSGSASYHDGAPTAASAVCVNGKSATRTALCSRTAEAATGSAWRQAAAPVASSSTMAARMGDARVAAAMLLHKEEFGSATRVLVGAAQDPLDFGRALLDLIMDWA